MSITIKRNTGYGGMASKIHIEVNGEKVCSIMVNQHVEIELPDGKAYLKVRQFGIKSNEIAVKDGDILEIIQKRWHRMSFPLMMTIMFLTIFIPNLTYRLITLLFVGVLLTISLFLIDGFHIKVLTDEINDEGKY